MLDLLVWCIIMLWRLVKYPDLNSILFVFRACPWRCRRPFPLLLFWNCLLRKIMHTLGIVGFIIIHSTSYFSFVGIAVMSINQTWIANVLIFIAAIEKSDATRRSLIVIIDTLRHFITDHLSGWIEIIWVVLNISGVMNLELALRVLLSLSTTSLTDLRWFRWMWSKAFTGPSMCHWYHLILEQFLLVGFGALQALLSCWICIFRYVR